MDYARTALLVQVAKLYFEQEMGQSEIAQRLDLSRSYVSKLLAEARRHNIVDIKIRDPLQVENEMERMIRQRYNLRKVIVVPSRLGDNAVSSVAAEAAKFLDGILKSDDIVGFGWGRTMYLMAGQLRERFDLSGVRLVSLYGLPGVMHQNIYSTESLTLASQALGAVSYVMAAPTFINSPATRAALMREESVAPVLDCALKANIAVFTLGAVQRASYLSQQGALASEQYKRLVAKGAMGEVCLHIYDRQGKLCDEEIDSRVISVPFDNLKQKDYRIGVASGRHKMDAVAAALEGGIVNVLVTDEDIAKDVLERIHEKG